MLTRTQLRDLVRALEATKVLTIYHSSRVTDPAMRHAWRPALASVIRSIRTRLTSERERARLDRAAAFLNDPVPPLDGVWGAPGWVAFLSDTGPLYTGELPVHPPTLAVWRDGPAVAPYVRALKQHRPVIVAIVDSRSARFYRYSVGNLNALPGLTLSIEENGGEGTSAPAVPRGISHPAPRSAVSSELSQRRRLAAFQRLTTQMVHRLTELAGDDAWILIGGTPEWARLAGDALPPTLADRAVISSSLDHDAHQAEIEHAAKRAASDLRAMHGEALVEELVERAGAEQRAAVGIPAVQRALGVHAVDQLVMSPWFTRLHEDLAEDMVRAALLQGADIEVLSGRAALHLDDAADGVAARLRFAAGQLPPGNGLTTTDDAAPPLPCAG